MLTSPWIMDRSDCSESAGAGASLDDLTRPAGEIADLERSAVPEWRCTVVWHPDATRIGAVARLSPTSGPWDFGRGEPVFHPGGVDPGDQPSTGDGALALGDAHVSRRAFRLDFTADGWRIERFPGSSRLRLNGRDVDAQAVLTDDRARRGFGLSLGQQILGIALPPATRSRWKSTGSAGIG